MNNGRPPARPAVLLLDERDTAAVALIPLQAGTQVEVRRGGATVKVVVDTLNAALGTAERWAPAEAQPGARAIEVGASRVANPNVNYIFRVFGRPPRTTACDCERAMDPALPQTLYRMTDPAILAKLRAKDNRINAILKSKKTDDEIFEELFLATMCRLPSAR